jgi:hypothetical protein
MSNRKGLAMPLHLACEKEEKGKAQRPTMFHVHFVGEFAYATNGYVIIKQHLDYIDITNKELLNGKAIHGELFKDLCKHTTAEATEKGIEATDKNGRKSFFPYAKDDIKAPLFEAVMPKEGEEKIEINTSNISPALIEIVSKCLYRESWEDYMTFDFYSGNKIVITLQESEYQMAMVMSKM